MVFLTIRNVLDTTFYLWQRAQKVSTNVKFTAEGRRGDGGGRGREGTGGDRRGQEGTGGDGRGQEGTGGDGREWERIGEGRGTDP